eukprot:scaffold105543_cov78-Phaeocystis_antarctica.AAC.9
MQTRRLELTQRVEECVPAPESCAERIERTDGTPTLQHRLPHVVHTGSRAERPADQAGRAHRADWQVHQDDHNQLGR